MADKEYGTHFKIVVLYNGGIKILTNELSLNILKIVMRKQTNITEISKIIKSSKTTVQANINSMVNDGLLVSCPDPSDNRSVIYSSNCIPILSSGNALMLDDPYRDKIKEDSDEIEDNIHRNAMIFFSNELCRHNVCIHPMLLDIGSSLASVFFKTFDLDKEGIIGLFCEVFGIPQEYFKDISLGESLSIRMGHESRSISDLSYLGYILMGSLLYYRYMEDGSVYARDVRLFKISGNEFVLSTDRMFTSVFKNEMKPIEMRDWKFYRCMDEFSFYQTDNGSSIIITNPTMIQVLEQLETSPRTVNAISDELGIRAITVHASIVKMISLGLVGQVDVNEVRNIRYKLTSHRVMFAKEDQMQFSEETVSDILDRFIRKEYDLYRTIYEMQFFIYSSAGIRHEHIIDMIASRIANELIDNNPKIEAEEYINTIKDCFFDEKTDLELISLVPIRFSLSCSDENGMRYIDSKIFIESMLKNGLKRLTGMDYPVVIEPRMK